jgi:hypothetical protein
MKRGGGKENDSMVLELTVDRKSYLLLHGFVHDVDIVDAARDEGSIVFG